MIMLGADTTSVPAIDTLLNSLANECSKVATSTMSAIGNVLPYGIGIAGALIALTLAFKAFKRFTKA